MKNIILIATLLIFAGCSSDEKKETTTKEVKKEAKQEVKQMPQKPKSKVLNEIAASRKVQANVAPTEEVTKKEVITKKEVVVEEKVEIKKEVVVIKEEPKEVAKAVKSGEEIFKACIACHGKNAEKVALGKSQIIKGWSASKISAALNGYKDGTYGGKMKVLMIGQVGFLTDEEVKSVSEYISKL